MNRKTIYHAPDVDVLDILSAASLCNTSPEGGGIESTYDEPLFPLL